MFFNVSLFLKQNWSLSEYKPNKFSNKYFDFRASLQIEYSSALRQLRDKLLSLRLASSEIIWDSASSYNIELESIVSLSTVPNTCSFKKCEQHLFVSDDYFLLDFTLADSDLSGYVIIDSQFLSRYKILGQNVSVIRKIFSDLFSVIETDHTSETWKIYDFHVLNYFCRRLLVEAKRILWLLSGY